MIDFATLSPFGWVVFVCVFIIGIATCLLYTSDAADE